MSTWALRLQSERKRLMLWVTIQGVERVFKERSASVSTIVLGETRAETACIPVGGIKVGETTIDPDRRCCVGGDLKLRLVQPRGTTILDDVFQPLKRKRTYLTATSYSRTSTATIDVADNTWAPAAGIIHMGAEAIAYTGKSGTTQFTGITRAKYGTRAQLHLGVLSGLATDGTAIFDVVPAWLGRRVTLYGSFLQDDGTTTNALTEQLGTYVIEAPPKNVDTNAWEIQAGPLSDAYAAKKAYVGIKDVKGGAIEYVSATDDTFRMEVDDGKAFATGGAGTYAVARFVGNDAYGMIGKVAAVDTLVVPNLLDIDAVPMLSPDTTEVVQLADSFTQVDTVRPIAIVGGATGAGILRLLTSRKGDGANGVYDDLAGRDRSNVYEDSWRLGCGIDVADIDTAAFARIVSNRWTYVLDESTTAGDLLREWALAADAYWYVDSAGLLSARHVAAAAETPVITISDANRAAEIPPEIYVDDSGIAPLVTVRANYDPRLRDFQFKMTVADAELLNRYPDRDEEKVFELKGLGVRVDQPVGTSWPQRFMRPNSIEQSEIEVRCRRMQMTDGRGRLMCRVVCRLSALRAGLGDTVSMSIDGPNHEGGTIRNRDARVMSIRPDYDVGTVTLTLHLMEKTYRVAPSVVVGSVYTTSIANDSISVTTPAGHGSSATLCDDFAVGQDVRLWDMSAGTSQVLTILALSTTDMQFTAGIVGAVELSRDWLTLDTLNTNEFITGGTGYDEDDFIFGVDDNGVSGVAGSDDTRRWR